MVYTDTVDADRFLRLELGGGVNRCLFVFHGVQKEEYPVVPVERQCFVVCGGRKGLRERMSQFI